uniref:Guanylate cyclase activator 2B n=1 Tax=Pavo cristatus TaxID=9049 RepID=A0A8C9LAK2_PAVCR
MLCKGFIKLLVHCGDRQLDSLGTKKKSETRKKDSVIPKQDKRYSGQKRLPFAGAMRGLLSFTVLALLLLVHSSQAVYVQDGNLKFSLESVKKLKELMDENRVINPRMVVLKASKDGYSPCQDEDLPEEFQPVCEREDAPMIFERLYLVANEADLCEICANAACSGCF